MILALMTAHPIPAETETAAARLAARMEALDRRVDSLVDIGMTHAEIGLARAQRPEATVETEVMCAKSYEGVSRSVRQSIMLACKMAEPKQAGRSAWPQRTAARARVIRGVEDVIAHKSADRSEAESLRAELLDRLDAPDFEVDIETRPPAEIIEEIARDLGLGDCPAGVEKWPRRTPETIAVLRAAAAEPSGQRMRDDAGRPRVEKPRQRVWDHEWDPECPDKPVSQWTDEELDSWLARHPSG